MRSLHNVCIDDYFGLVAKTMAKQARYSGVIISAECSLLDHETRHQDMSTGNEFLRNFIDTVEYLKIDWTEYTIVEAIKACYNRILYRTSKFLCHICDLYLAALNRFWAFFHNYLVIRSTASVPWSAPKLDPFVSSRISCETQRAGAAASFRYQRLRSKARRARIERGSTQTPGPRPASELKLGLLVTQTISSEFKQLRTTNPCCYVYDRYLTTFYHVGRYIGMSWD